MKVGIAGFSGSGKSLVFTWLTGVKPDPGKAQHGQMGVAKIPDERLDWLSAHFKPKKTTYTTLELLDTPGLLLDERRDNPRRLAIMRDAGALLVVLNGYANGDLAQELTRFREEILFADLEIVAGRILTMLGELDSRAHLHRPPLCEKRPPKHAFRDDRQVLEPRQEIGGEQHRRCGWICRLPETQASILIR